MNELLPKDFKKEFSQIVEEIPLSEMRSYVASAPNGSIIFIPRIKRYGAECIWEGRVHIKGAMGPVRISQESLQAIGAPEEWLPKAKAFRAYLQQLCPVMELPAARKELED